MKLGPRTFSQGRGGEFLATPLKVNIYHCSPMAKMQSVRISDVARASEFPLILWNCFTLFWCSRAGGTYDNQTLDQDVQKKLLHILQCHLFSPQLAFNVFEQILCRQKGFRLFQSPALHYFSVRNLLLQHYQNNQQGQHLLWLWIIIWFVLSKREIKLC